MDVLLLDLLSSLILSVAVYFSLGVRILMSELITYYVIAGALIIGAPAIFFLIAFMLFCRTLRVVWWDTKTTRPMVTHPSMRTPLVITQSSISNWEVDNDFNSVYNYKYRPSSFCWRTL